MVANVNHDRCLDVVKTLRGVLIPAPKEEVPALPFSPPEEANFWFFLAALCHQTSPLGEPPLRGEIDGVTKTGWDYLLHTFRAAAIKDARWLHPERWAACSEIDLRSLMGPLLRRPDVRAGLIRNLAEELSQRGWASIIEAGQYCDFQIAAHNSEPSKADGAQQTRTAPNLLDILAEFEAFSDPVQKKSVFFLALMKNANIWSYRDETQLPAPVDYHETRGHLRIGTVVLTDNLRQKIVNEDCITSVEDIAIRSAVRDAIRLICNELQTSPNALHYFLWNLFRTYCLRTEPHCDGRQYATLPAVYQSVVNATGARQCPFRGVCQSTDQRQAINEPRVDTDFY